MDAPSRAGVARTLDTRQPSGAHTLASVEPPSYDIQGAESAADRLYSLDCDPPAPEQTLPGGVTIHSLVPKTSRVPRIQECRLTESQHDMDRRSD